jgi:hypothetical protein
MFRFTIRELVLLTLIVGLGLGWGLERLEQTRLRARLDFLERGAHMVIKQERISVILDERSWPSGEPVVTW